LSKKALGKGIEALLREFPEGREGVKGQAIEWIAVVALRSNEHQPRREFQEENLQELAESIKHKGILQPLLVEKKPDGYAIVAGERRYRAAKLAGLERVPAVVKDFTELERVEIALIENLQREDLTPLEEASAFLKLMQLASLSQEEIARRVGKKRSTVANSLRLLKLPQKMLEALNQRQITAGHARAILSMVNPADQELLFKRILEQDLSVRQAERFASRLSQGLRGSSKKKPTRGAAGRSAELQALEQKCIEALGTKVAIRGSEKKGRIEINYFSAADLDRIFSLLTRGEG